MYVYLYDQYTKEKKHQPVIKQVENRLTDIGIAGKIVRLQNFTNADSIIEQEMKQLAEQNKEANSRRDR